MKQVLSVCLVLSSILLISCDAQNYKTSMNHDDNIDRPQIEYFYPCNNSYKFLTLKRQINPSALNQNYWNGTILLRNYFKAKNNASTVLSDSNELINSFIHIVLQLSSEAKVFLVDDQNGLWRIYSGVTKFHVIFNGGAKPLDRIDFWVEGKSNNRFPQVTSLEINEEELCYRPSKWSPTNIKNSYNDVYINDDNNWPWFASLLRITNEYTRIFVCGGSIINERTIITAASCFYGFEDSRITIDQYTIEVGKFNRKYKYRDQTTIEYEIESILQHPEYQPFTYEHNNVALIILNIPIQYNDFTAPIAICDQQCYTTSNLNRRNQLVIGWGPEIKLNRLESNPISIIPYDDCIRTNPQFYSAYLDHQSFCAGNSTGSRICTGFGGSGLIVQVNSLWYLQAIVSIAPPNLSLDTTNMECYLRNFVIFTDLIYFGSWINGNKFQ